MKEVHKYRRNPIDITDSNPSLKSQFVEVVFCDFIAHSFIILYYCVDVLYVPI